MITWTYRINKPIGLFLDDDNDYPHKDKYILVRKEKFLCEYTVLNLILILLFPITYLLYLGNIDWQLIDRYDDYNSAYSMLTYMKFPVHSKGAMQESLFPNSRKMFVVSGRDRESLMTVNEDGSLVWNGE